MVPVSRSIRVERPIETVFEYLDNPQNHVEITPSLTEVRTIESNENGGKRVEHTYSMAGVNLDGTLDERVHEENRRMVFDLSGDLQGEISITLDDVDDATQVTYAAEYDVPGRVLSAVAEPFIKRYNERELQTTLENLKTRLEAGTPERERTGSE